MIAEKNSVMDRTISGIWQLTEDNLIREQCSAREEWIINDNRKNEIIEQQKATMEQQKDEIEALKQKLYALKGRLDHA